MKRKCDHLDTLFPALVLSSLFLLTVTGLCQINQFPLQLSGRVVDSRNGEPIASANIEIAGTGWGTASDANGYFEFRSIPSGTYQLKISHVAYADKSMEIRIQPGIPQYLSVSLTALVVTLPEVNVEISSAGNDVTEATTVIDRGTINRSHARTVGDLLASVGAVFVKEQGSGGSQYVSIRGSASNQVVVMIDGRRLNSPGSGDVDLSTIPVDAVERVEITKGPNPVHGGDAIGGVIQIITRSPETTSERSLEIGGGSFGARHGRFYLSQEGNPGVAFSGSIAGSNGRFGYVDRFGDRRIRENAEFNSDNLYWKTQGWISRWQLTLTASQYHVKRGIPGDLDQLTPHARLEQRIQGIDLHVARPFERGDVLWIIYGGQEIAHHQNPTAFVPLDARDTEKNAGGSITLKYDLLTRLHFEVGHETRWDKMISPSIESGNAERWSNGSYVQTRYDLTLPRWMVMPKLDLKGTLRHDLFSDVGREWTYQTGFFWGREGAVSYNVMGNVGTAFRVPTFTSLFWKEDVFARGNPNLRPEHSRNKELGAGIGISRFANVHMTATRFWQDIDDIILWRRGFDGRWAPYNVSHAQIDGVELSAKLSPSKDWIWVEYTGTFLRPINHSGEPNYEGRDLTYRPRNVSQLSSGVKWRAWWLDYSVQWVSRRQIRESNSIPLAADGMGPYRLMNIDTGKQVSLLNCQWQIKCEIRNLENRQYRVVERSPMPGREWRASIAIEVP